MESVVQAVPQSKLQRKYDRLIETLGEIAGIVFDDDEGEDGDDVDLDALIEGVRALKSEVQRFRPARRLSAPPPQSHVAAAPNVAATSAVVATPVLAAASSSLPTSASKYDWASIMSRLENNPRRNHRHTFFDGQTSLQDDKFTLCGGEEFTGRGATWVVVGRDLSRPIMSVLAIGTTLAMSEQQITTYEIGNWRLTHVMSFIAAQEASTLANANGPDLEAARRVARAQARLYLTPELIKSGLQLRIHSAQTHVHVVDVNFRRNTPVLVQTSNGIRYWVKAHKVSDAAKAITSAAAAPASMASA